MAPIVFGCVWISSSGACHLQRVLFTDEGVQKISTTSGSRGWVGKTQENGEMEAQAKWLCPGTGKLTSQPRGCGSFALLKLAYEDLCDVVLAPLPAPDNNKNKQNKQKTKEKSIGKKEQKLWQSSREDVSVEQISWGRLFAPFFSFAFIFGFWMSMQNRENEVVLLANAFATVGVINIFPFYQIRYFF